MNSKKFLVTVGLLACGLFALTGCNENFSSSSGGPVVNDSSSAEVEDPSLGFKAEGAVWSHGVKYTKVYHNGQEIVCYIYDDGYSGGLSCMSLADSKIILQGDKGELNDQ